ncbi:MAG: depupylase/deamidase Dop [Actinomycetales bacterium]
MSVRRVMGIETEYGVSDPRDPAANPIVMSAQVVNAYAAPLGTRVGQAAWDYEDESPLTDARGWQVGRGQAHASQLTDTPGGEFADELDDPTMANVVLTNGARLYVDHAHPEYSSPEVTNPLDGLLWDKAGEQVMLQAVRRLAVAPGMPPLNLYKNTTDNKGVSYGTHENYLMPREVPFPSIVTGLIPFFVSRQVITGAGRVGRGQDGDQAGYQISQRADFFEVEVGLETTLKRPIVNTRDEPHANADRFRRLHVIVGDANLCEVAGYLKLGTTSLVLSLIEAGRMPDLYVSRPVATMHAVSHDPTLTQLITLTDGRTLTAIDLQRALHEAAAQFVQDEAGSDADPMTLDVLDRWVDVLDRLERDPMLCARELDWVAKLRLLEGFRQRESLDWEHLRLQAIDLQYADVRPERGLYQRLLARDAVDRLLTDDQISAAVTDPPIDTRAYFRGHVLAKFGANVTAASWDSLIFDVPGFGALQRVPMLDPLRGTREHVGQLLLDSETAEELVRALTGR